MTDSLKGRRFGANVRAPRGVPADYTAITTTIGSEVFIEWVAASALPVATPVTEDDGSGGFELVFDDDGNVIYDG